MTQKNIEIMDMIVDKMAEGKTLAAALKDVYKKRNVVVPFEGDDLNVSVDKLGMSNRTTYALMRGKLFTLADVVKYCETQKITTIKLLGVNAGIEAFEAMVNYLWGKMGDMAKVNFLIDIVERNAGNVREELM